MEEDIRWFSSAMPINSLGEIFAKEYHGRRYLRRLTKSELDARVADIASNLLALDDEGTYRPRFSVRENGIYAPIRNLDLLRMATDVWEETRIRAAGLREPLLPTRLQIAKRLSDESWCRQPDWISGSRLSLDKYELPRMLFKFGEAQWNRELFYDGRIRISPASAYGDTIAINAVRDDELRLEWYDTSLTLQALETRDYFCLCFSSEYDYRLFVDFHSNSCVAIKDRAAFSERLRHAISEHNELHPSSRIARLNQCPVVYVDPFSLVPPETSMEVQFCKHFRFTYQTEFRFVLTPAGDRQLEPFFLNVGSISDIAEMVIAPDGTEIAGAT